MQRGATWLGSKLQTAGGRSVTYRRANQPAVTLTGVPIKVIYTATNNEGMQTQIESWDWGSILATDLGFKPIPGDKIRETLNGEVIDYEVFEPGDNPCFELMDTAGILWVIHSSRTA